MNEWLGKRVQFNDPGGTVGIVVSYHSGRDNIFYVEAPGFGFLQGTPSSWHLVDDSVPVSDARPNSVCCTPWQPSFDTSDMELTVTNLRCCLCGKKTEG
jgi:hypothetical protein